MKKLVEGTSLPHPPSLLPSTRCLCLYTLNAQLHNHSSCFGESVSAALLSSLRHMLFLRGVVFLKALLDLLRSALSVIVTSDILHDLKLSLLLRQQVYIVSLS